MKAGGTFNDVLTALALRDLLLRPDVDAAEYRLYRSDDSSAIILALIVRTRRAAPKPAAGSKGVLASRRWSDFPTLYEDDRSQVRVALNPSVGVYGDRQAWLGNPTSFNPRYETPSALAWPEFGLEAGASGIVRAGQSPVYVYGAASYVFSGTLAQDVFSAKEQRVHGEIEKLYGGLLVARRGGRAAFDLSIGRQKFSLNRHLIFGFVLGSTNGGDRGGELPVAAPGPGPRRQRQVQGWQDGHPGIPRRIRTSCPWRTRNRGTSGSTCATTTTRGSTRP